MPATLRNYVGLPATDAVKDRLKLDFPIYTFDFIKAPDDLNTTKGYQDRPTDNVKVYLDESNIIVHLTRVDDNVEGNEVTNEDLDEDEKRILKVNEKPEETHKDLQNDKPRVKKAAKETSNTGAAAPTNNASGTSNVTANTVTDSKANTTYDRSEPLQK